VFPDGPARNLQAHHNIAPTDPVEVVRPAAGLDQGPQPSQCSESAPVKTSIAQLVMQDARNDQLFRPVKFCSFDCFRQSAHFSFSLAHLAFA
jgi:hypothetical protein